MHEVRKWHFGWIKFITDIESTGKWYVLSHSAGLNSKYLNFDGR